MQKIAIHSVPRSGSTWLGNLFNSSPSVSFKFQPLFSYSLKGYLDENSTNSDVETFFDLIAKSDDDFINQKKGIENGIIPVFIKNEYLTHVCYKEVRYHNVLANLLKKSKGVKFVFLIRNPLAVLYSWKNAPKEFRSDKGWIFEEEWMDSPKKNNNKPEEFNGYYKWKEAALLFHELYKSFPNQVYIINYSDLIRNTLDEVKGVFKFSNLEITTQTIDFINKSKSVNHIDSYSVYKKKSIDNDWKKLPENIIRFIEDDLRGTLLEIYLNE